MDFIKQKCLRCGFEWETKLLTPRACPKCKNYNWNTPPKFRKDKKEELPVFENANAEEKQNQ